MLRIPIRSFSGGKAERVFDVLVVEGSICFEVKTGKNEYKLITLDEFLFQVETALNNRTQKQEENYPDKPHTRMPS